jgi:hypothetical protein
MAVQGFCGPQVVDAGWRSTIATWINFTKSSFIADVFSPVEPQILTAEALLDQFLEKPF